MRERTRLLSATAVGQPALAWFLALSMAPAAIAQGSALDPPAWVDADQLGPLLSELGGAEADEYPCCQTQCRLANCQMEQGVCPPGFSCLCTCEGWAAVCTCYRPVICC
jgi:hypothetical protein